MKRAILVQHEGGCFERAAQREGTQWIAMAQVEDSVQERAGDVKESSATEGGNLTRTRAAIGGPGGSTCESDIVVPGCRVASSRAASDNS